MSRSTLKATRITGLSNRGAITQPAAPGPDAPEIPVLEFVTRELDSLLGELVSLTDWVNNWSDKTVGSRVKELKTGSENKFSSPDVVRPRIDTLRDKVQQTYAEFHSLKEAVYRINEL